MNTPRARAGNRLLELLPHGEAAKVHKHLTQVTLPFATRLATAGEPITKVYFLDSGIASVIIAIPGEKQSEVGLFGWDGFVPTTAASGAPTHSYEIIMQVEGQAQCLDYETFGMLMETLDEFPRIVHLAQEAFAVQVSYTATTNTVQGIDRRLARWILMCHDRVQDDVLPLTHNFLATMLGVRRPSVTTALHELEGHGLIRSTRRSVEVRERPALERFAGELYGPAEERQNELLLEVSDVDARKSFKLEG